MMHLCKLCRPYGGGDAHGVDHRGVLIPGAAIVAVADPHGLAVSEAGSRGEAHGRGGGRLLFNFTGWGSPATIPAGSSPTVTFSTAAVDLLGIEAIIEIEIEDLAWHVLNLGEQGVGFHGSSRLVDGFILQGQRGIWQSPGDTWLIATHWAAVAAFMPATVALATLIRLAPRQSIPRVMERRIRFAIGCLVWYAVILQGQWSGSGAACATPSGVPS